MELSSEFDRIGSDQRKGNVPQWTVSEAAREVRRTVETSFAHVQIIGEISGFRGPHTSGHVYFSLKDPRARLDAVIWRGVYARLSYRPEEGAKIVARGRISTFPGRSNYQLIVEDIAPAGLGDLHVMLERRRKKLAAEGLFDSDRKRPIPRFPEVIGLITSPTGAAIRDVLHRIQARLPRPVIVWPTRVQGETASAEIIAAILGMNKIANLNSTEIPAPEVIIIARGGGSIEDLWCFNDEEVVRAVAACTVPVISAIGHETDWTLIDHVADRRAPTPSAAAEMAVPEREGLYIHIDQKVVLLRQRARSRLKVARELLNGAKRIGFRATEKVSYSAQRYDQLESRLNLRPRWILERLFGRLDVVRARLTKDTIRIRLSSQKALLNNRSRRSSLAFRQNAKSRIDRLARCGLSPRPILKSLNLKGDLVKSLNHAMHGQLVRNLRQRNDRLAAATSLLRALGFQTVLNRGFALARDADGKIIRNALQIQKGDSIKLELAHGQLMTEVLGRLPTEKR